MKNQILKKEIKQIRYGINNKLVFGKYIGQTVGHITATNPDYIRWCIENGYLKLNNLAYTMLEEREDRY